MLTVKENQSKLLDMLLLLYSIKKMILYFIPIRFSCDFHITQDVDSDEEIDGDSEHSHTLMSAQFEIEIDQKEKPKNHWDAMRLQAENLEQAAQSNYTSRVTSRITSVAPSLVASALQSRNTSRTMSRVPSRASMVSTSPLQLCCLPFFP